MKVDTKKMTPMSKIAPETMKNSPDSCLFHKNKYIVDGASPLNEEEKKDDSGEGSWIAWIPTLIFTPVKRSYRNKSRDTLDTEGVEELNSAFAKLLIGDYKNDNDDDSQLKKEETKDEEQAEEKKDSVHDAKSKHEEPVDEDEKENREKLGRFVTTRKSEKTFRTNKVMRSYRLVDEDDNEEV